MEEENTSDPKNIGPVQRRVVAWRARLGWLRWPVVLAIAAAPTYLHLYSPFSEALTGLFARLLSTTLAALLVAILATRDGGRLIGRMNLFFGFVLVGGLFYAGGEFTRVTDYPFSLSWSEGNRLYDYSLYLGADRYLSAEDIEIVWNAPGRYLLWGIWFAIPDTPIWVHRLWDAVLWTAPYLLLGYLLARWRAWGALGKWTFALWALLFLAQGPIYAPLVLSAILVVITVRRKPLLLALVGAAAAGYYAAVSRWTWIPAPAAWAVLILLSDFELRKGEPLSKLLLRLAPIGLVGAVGLAGGMLADPTFFLPQKVAASTTMSQPLLWHRLLPNVTYREGILLGLAIAAGPAIVLLTWLVASKRWLLNGLQIAVCAGVSLAFLGLGLVASVKIGGGNNLHNLDMFLVTVLLMLGLAVQSATGWVTGKWPPFARALLALVILAPVWSGVSSPAPRQLPPAEEIGVALAEIDKQVHKYLEFGEVLFMDQRQLLTFGYLEDVPLVQEYEKKYLMNQAMANDRAYFEGFYRDLASHRFSLIVSEPLSAGIQGADRDFGLENDAWVKWVVRPTLCYYKPFKTARALNLQILLPREELNKRCPEFAIVE
jgi:hypothetical protein